MNDFPKIRYVDFFPVDTENGQMIALRDQTGISPEMLVLSPDVFFLLQYFDGNHSLDLLRQEYMKTFNKSIELNQLQQIRDMLDEYFFLENNRFRRKKRQTEAEFEALPARPPAHAGQSYQADPNALVTQMDTFFEKANGVQHAFKQKQIKGLIAPHIDIRAGGVCYSYAYKVLAEAQDIDCFVILGTGHQGLEKLYSVLPKDFDTPLGTVHYDSDFIELLYQYDPEIANPELLPHKTEHTIEFQTVFLKYLLRDKPFTIVPVLCSFSFHMLDENRFPRERRIIERFTTALREALAACAKRVCLIASVDFSHVGPHYGDEVSPDRAFMEKVRQADRNLFAQIERADADGFYQSVAAIQDRYRVCGFSPIYTMLRSLKAQKGTLLNYASTKMDERNSTVTFASMVLE